MQIDLNQAHTRLYTYIDKYINSERKAALLNMYEDLGDRVYLAPASSYEHFHNAFPGGYIDHILRVTDFALSVYEMYKASGMDVGDFTEENLVFSALHHDLGKLGFPGENQDRYIVNDSEWHRTKLGQVYKPNTEVPFMLVQDQSLFLLQHYGIALDWVEYFSIKVHDGLYDDTNKPYLIAKSADAKVKSNLPYILHTADHMAAKYEYERWAAAKQTNGGTKPVLLRPVLKPIQTKNNASPAETSDLNKAFDALFGGKVS